METTKSPLQSVLECKEGAKVAMGNILSEKSTTKEQFLKMEEYQGNCLQNIKILTQKVAQEPRTTPNILLLTALEKTESRLIVDQKMVKLLNYGSQNGTNVGEEMYGMIYAAQLVTQREHLAWDEYKEALEELPPVEATTQGQGVDFIGWGFLIIMGFIVIRALLKKQGAKTPPNEKPPV